MKLFLEKGFLPQSPEALSSNIRPGSQQVQPLKLLSKIT